MRQLNIEDRLTKIEENIVAIKRMLEQVLNKPLASSSIENDIEIMSVKEVAQFLNIDANIIYAKCAKGDIPFFKIGKGYRFKKADIHKWVQKQKEIPEFSVEDYVDKYIQTHILKG